jgi:DNA-binding transcriptional LysR family regulator
MDTRQLAALVAVVDRSSFSHAAEQLGVTQPAVSLSIRSLERKLGATLIDRSGRQIEPTQAGRAVYRIAQRMLALEDDLARGVGDETGMLAGLIQIGASTGPGERLLPRLLIEFHTANPEVMVSLRVEDTEAIIERVLDRQLEAGIVGAERLHRSLLYEPFLRDEVVLCVPIGHPFANRLMTLADLRATPLILQQEGAGVRSVIERELRAAGVRQRDLTIVGELGLQESVKSAVESGFGVTFLSRLAIARELDEGRLTTSSVQGLSVSRLFYTVRSSRGPVSRPVRAFLEFARESLADAGAVAGAQRPAGPMRGGRVG